MRSINLLTNRINKNQGFSLIEILVALGIMAALMVGIVSLVDSSSKSAMNTRISLTRDRLANLATLYISKTGALKNSISHTDNTLFERCVNTNLTSTPDCTAGTSQPFTMREPAGNMVFSGTTTAPIHYDTTGLTCTIVSGNCPLEVITSFTAICPMAAATCDQAQALQITFEVRKAPSLVGSTTWSGIISNRSATITKTVSEVLGSATSCPPGKCVTGIMADGSVQCEP